MSGRGMKANTQICGNRSRPGRTRHTKRRYGKARKSFEEGEEDDVNPCLSRTKWHKYLKKPNPTDMIASVAAPSTDPDKPEPYETVIWKAMTNLAHISQITVSKAGVFVRMKGVRSEKHQTRYMPLETY